MSDNYTALYEQHKKAGASFTDFGGWQMPLKYESELAEHHAVRNAAGLFDLSHMGEVWVTGPQAAAFLDYALVGKLSAVAEGKAKYSLICDADGGIIDDLITYRRPSSEEGVDKFLVVPNAGNAAWWPLPCWSAPPVSTSLWRTPPRRPHWSLYRDQTPRQSCSSSFPQSSTCWSRN